MEKFLTRPSNIDSASEMSTGHAQHTRNIRNNATHPYHGMGEKGIICRVCRVNNDSISWLEAILLLQRRGAQSSLHAKPAVGKLFVRLSEVFEDD